MTAPEWIPAEYEAVRIPAEIAAEHGVDTRGTIIDIPHGARVATVECMRLGGRRGFDSEIIDVAFEDLRRED